MKLRFLLCLLFPLGTPFVIHLEAQTQTAPATADTSAPAAPLQLQENPVPPPAPTSPAATPDSSVTNPGVTTPVPPDTNAAAQPTPNNLVPGPNDPAAPAPDSGMGSPGQNPPPSDPNSLIPPPQEPLPPSPINTAGNEETQRQQQKARYYTVKVKADKDEDLSSLLDQADKAKSDEAKRQALREYYDLLAKRMKKLDSSLSDWIDTMHAAYLRRLDQVRVEPTIPMNLPPVPSTSDEVSPSPTPSSSVKKKRKPAVEEDSDSTVKSKAVPSPSPTPAKKSHGKRIWPF